MAVLLQNQTTNITTAWAPVGSEFILSVSGVMGGATVTIEARSSGLRPAPAKVFTEPGHNLVELKQGMEYRLIQAGSGVSTSIDVGTA